MLISDRGFRGLAIKVEAPPGQRNRGEVLEETGQTVRLRCQAGAFSAGLARWTAGLGWHDLEWACGIPGTIGGAAAGNAGAYDGDMARSVERVRAWFPEGERTLEGAEMELPVPRLPLQAAARPAAAGSILAVELRLTPRGRQQRPWPASRPTSASAGRSSPPSAPAARSSRTPPPTTPGA